ncbi:MAG: ParA family protein [Microbacterium sp.]
MPHKVMFGNHKGGVGKSSVVVQTAAALARAGKRVLVVDMDPQASSSAYLGFVEDPDNPVPTISEALRSNERGAGAGAVYECGWVDDAGEQTVEASLIHLIPCRADFENREVEAGQVGAVRRLRKALEGWTDEYDYVLIDTPPRLGHLTQMSMAASDAVIIVTEPERDGTVAAFRFAEFVTEHAEDVTNPDLRLAGVVLNKRRHTAEHQQRTEDLQSYFNDLLWDLRTTEDVPGIGERELSPTWLPGWSVFSNASSFKCSVSSLPGKPARQITTAFDQIARRLSEHFAEEEKAA